MPPRPNTFRLLAVLGGLLVLGLMTAQAANAATTRAQATKTALTTLKVKKGKAPVVVFQMLQPLPRKVKITEIGPARFAATRKVKPTVLYAPRTTDRVWMFYADTNPYGQYQHPGRIVLVSVRTGRVLLNKPTKYAPMVNGKLPPFLGNSRRYEAKTWRVFYRAWRQSPKVVPSARSGVQADPSLRSDLAKALGAQNTCIVIAGARGPGITGEVSARSATFVEWYFRSLAKLDGGIGVWRYPPASSTKLADFLEEVASEQPCDNILLYIAGQAAATGDPLVMLDTAKVQEIRAKQLLKLLRAHRSTKVSIVLDASQATRFYKVLKNEPNLVAYLAPRGPKNVAFGYLPEIQVGKKLEKNTANPRRIDEFTNDLLYGLNVFTTSPSEVAHAIANTVGANGSIAAWMLGRGERIKSGSGMSDRTGSSTDDLHERQPSSPPPPVVIPNTPPVSTNLAITTNEDTPVAVPFAATDAQSDAFTFEIATQPAHGSIALNGTGPATYTPAANYDGPDTLTYRAIDVQGGIGEPATVTITVAPVEDAPSVTLDPAATFTENDPDRVLTPNATVVDIDAAPQPIVSATISFTAGYVLGEDVLAATDTPDITGTFDAPSGVLTLTGVATSAAYEQVLRTITYSNSAGTAVTEGPRTITVTLTSSTGVTGGSGLTLAVFEYNEPPTSADATINATEDTPQAFTITGNDPEGAAVDLVIVTTPSHGQISGTGLTRTYEPDLDYSGSDSFTFRVQDAKGASSVAVYTATITIAAVNDAPLVTIGGSLAYTENDAAAEISIDASITDVDSSDLTGVVVSITGCEPPEDVLAFTNTAAITGTFTAGTCTMSLSGTASVADYQAALRTVTYRNTSDDPHVTARTISVTATDAASATSPAATKPLTVIAQNDKPVVTASGGATAYTERSAAVAIDPTLSVTDADNLSLSAATVTITSGRVTGDVLGFVTQNGITGSFNGTTGVLTLTGTSLVTNYQAALRSVTFANPVSTAPGTTRTVEFVARDTADWSTATIKNIAVTEVDDAPVIATSGGSSAYTELAPAIVVDSGITVSDADSTTLTSATATISSGRTAGDVLAFVDQNGIIGNFVPGTGILTLTGPASVSTYQAALRTIEFSSTSTSPGASKVVTFVVSDASGASLGATKTIAVTQVNDAPVVTASGGATPFNEQGAAVAIDNAITVTDTDDASLEGATATITSGKVTGDALNFTTQNGIAGTYVPGTGVLTLTGTAPVADYQTALRSITFSSTSQAPGTARVISFAARDAADTSMPSTKNITVSLVNDAPVVTTTVSALTYTENAGAVAVDNALTVVDVDSATLAGATATISANYAAGEDTLLWTDADGADGITLNIGSSTPQTIVLQGTGSAAAYQAALRLITYTNSSEAPSATPRTVAFTATDGLLTSAAANRTINVVPVDDPPVAVDDSFPGVRNAGPTAQPVLANDTDVDGGAAPSIQSVTQPPNGVVVRTGGGTGLTYAPNPGYCDDGVQPPTDVFTYTLVGGSVGTVTMTITCVVNQPPVAANFTLSGNSSAVGNTPLVYDGPADGAPSVTTARKLVTGGLLSHASDPDVGDVLTVTPATNLPTSGGGRVTIESDGDFVYHPKLSSTACGADEETFDYTVTDSGGLTDTGTATVQIRGCVWYVKNDAAGGGTGDADHPFNSLTPLTTPVTGLIASAGPNAVFSIAKGNGTASGMNAGITPGPNQSLIGEGADLVVDPDGAGATYAPATLKAANPTGHPLLTNDGGTVVATSSDSTVSGVLIDPKGAGYGIDTTPGNQANVTVSDVRIIDSGLDAGSSNVALGADSTTTSLRISNLTIDTNGIGVVLAGGSATFDPTGTISITTRDQLAISQTSSTALTGEVDEVTVTGATASGVSFAGITGSGFTLGSSKLDLTGSSGVAALSIAGASSLITVPATSNATINTNGPALAVTALASGSNLNFDTINVPTSSAGSISWAPGAASTASLTVASGSIVGAGSVTTPIVLTNGTGNVDLSGLTIGDSAAVNSVNVGARSAGSVKIGRITDGTDNGGGPTVGVISGTGSVEFTDTITVTTNATAGITLSGASGTGSITFTGNVTNIGNAAGAALSIAALAGGSITFNGTVNTTSNSTGAGITMAMGASASGSITFNGEVTTLATGNGAPFVHTGTTGTALTLSFLGGLHATAQGTGVAFSTGSTTLTVSAGPVGSTLSSGSGGALRAASTAFAAAGATFQSISSNGALNGIYLNGIATSGFLTVTGTGGTCAAGGTCTGGVIQGTTNAGAGVILTDVRAPVNLSSMSVSGTGDGILSATRIESLALDNMYIVGNGNAVNEHGIEILNSTGTNSLTNSTVSGSFDSNFMHTSTITTTTAWTITGNTFAAPQNSNVSFSSVAGQTSSLTFTGNALTGGGASPTPGTNSILLRVPGTAQNKTNIANNTMSGAPGDAIAVLTSTPNSSGAHLAEVTINNNVIGTGAVGSGSSAGRGISLNLTGVGKLRALITNNTIRHYFTNAMDFAGQTSTAAGRFDVTATGNTMSDPDNAAGTHPGINVRAGVTGTDTFTMCFDVGGAGALANSFAGSANGTGGGATDFGFSRNGSVVQPAGWNGIDFPGYLTARNTGTPTIGATTGINTVGNPASCTLPTLP